MQMSYDVNKVRSLTSQSEAAKSIFSALALRKRNTGALDIRRLYRDLLKAGKNIPKDELSQVFRRLEDLGVGKLIYSKRKKAHKFLWNTQLLNFVKDVTEEKQQEAIQEAKIEQPVTIDKGDSIIVRQGNVEFIIPSNVSNAALVKFAKLIRRINKQ